MTMCAGGPPRSVQRKYTVTEKRAGCTASAATAHRGRLEGGGAPPPRSFYILDNENDRGEGELEPAWVAARAPTIGWGSASGSLWGVGAGRPHTLMKS